MVLHCEVDDCSRAAECSSDSSGSEIVRRESPPKWQFHVGVRIDTARDYQLARCVQNAVGDHVEPGSYHRHAFILYKDIADVIVDRRNNPPILYQRFHSSLNLSIQAHQCENSSAGSPNPTGGNRWMVQFQPTKRAPAPRFSNPTSGSWWIVQSQPEDAANLTPDSKRPKRPIQSRHQLVHVRSSRYKGRSEPDDVPVQPAFADQHAAFPGLVEHPQHSLRVRLFGLAILHAFNCLHQTHAAYVPDNLVLLLQLIQSAPQVTADVQRILRQIVFLDHPYCCQRCR